MIYAKKLKKKCMVRGCGNTETFALSRSGSEFGNVFICASCLAEGLSQVDEARKDFEEKEKKKASKPSSPAPLFYHPENHVTKTIEQSPEPIENVAVDEAVDEVVDEADKSVDEASDEVSTAVDEVTDDIERDSKKKATGFICVECGREFDTLKGLNMHANVHKE